MRRAAIIAPGNNKPATTEIRHGRLVLGTAIGGEVDQEVIANRLTGSAITLTEYINTAAAIVRAALIITPGDDKTTIGKRRYRRFVLRPRRIAIDQELIDISNRRISRGRAVHGGEGLGEDVVAGTALGIVAAITVPPGNRETVTMGNNRWLRNSFVYLLVIIGVIVIFYTLLPSFGGTTEQPLTTVIAMAKNHEIREIVVDGEKLTVYPLG